MNLKLNRNHYYLYNLIAIAKSDGDIHEKEAVFLKLKAEQLGFTEEELSNLVDYAGDIDFVIPTSEVEKLSYLNDSIDMALSDGLLTYEEIKRCLRICSLMGLNEELLYEAISSRNISYVK